MKAKARTYRSPLRDRQAAGTRERILEALAGLITEDGLDEISFKAVAQAAEVTEITVYRHFPSRAELLRALWYWLDRRLGQPGMPQNEHDLVEDTRNVLAGFDDMAPIIRAALLSKEGRAMRMAVQAERRAAFETALAGATAGATAAERARALAVIQLLYSGYAWLSMRDHWGLTGKQAGEASAWAISVLLAELHRERDRRARSTNKPQARRGHSKNTRRTSGT